MNEEVDDETVAVAGSTPSLIASASRGKPLDKTEDTATKKRALPTTTHRNLDLDKENEAEWDPVPESLDDDLDQAGKAYLSTFREKQKDMIDSLDLGQYAIAGNTNDWARAEAQIAKDGASSVVSVKNPESTKKRKQKAVMDELIKEGERSVKTPSKKKGRSGKRHSTR
ncbi:N-acetyltransferase 10 [Dispira parvispora]|uniref:N-acetyltransferase 10 n=1 Tax=Dispira parvispora TaxID=1520584 RepID=A0A9W8AG37_9FUNG|nr:N-acetyltransferase 10 [Dispira parvispora]